MKVQLLLIATLALTGAYRPGVPPQCFDEYQCVFYRFNLSGLEYIWDLRSLCAGPNSEYRASQNGNAPGSFPQIRFNVCGTVAKPIAPLNDTRTGMRLPLPHSHGVAIQYLDDPENPAENPNNVQGIDIDTCDQATNPQCLLSGNYPAVANPGATQVDPNRIAQCVTDPSYYYCKPVTTPVADNAEVIAYYDGSPPMFALYDETNPQGGINLTYQGASAYSVDPYPCGSVDPATGITRLRNVNLFIGCDMSVNNLTVNSYSEIGVCQYYITALSKYACGVSPPPATPTVSPSTLPSPSVALVLAGTVVGSLFGGVVITLGVLWVAANVVGYDLATTCRLRPDASRTMATDGGSAFFEPLYAAT